KEVPEAGIKPYRIKEINIYPNYDMGRDSLDKDVERFNERNYIQDEVYFRPDRLDPFVLIEEGDLYNPEKSGKTSRRLTSIGTYKFVNIRYDEIDSLATDSTRALAANIFLSPLNKRSLRAELQAVVKSNNFMGPSLATTLTNRNLFKGGEILNTTASVGYEMQLAGGSNTGLNSLQLGLKTDLIFPWVLSPVRIKENWFEYAITKTKKSVG